MTFYEINAAIQEEMQLDPGLVSDAERIRFINDCSGEIAQLHLLEASAIDTTSSQYPTAPTDMLKLKSLYWDDIRLPALTTGYDTDTTGTPIGYIYEGEVYRLYPAPDEEATLRWVYTYMPTQMTADMLVEASAEAYASYPNVPLGWEMLYVNYACYRSHRKNGNILMSNVYQKDYEKSLSYKMRDYISRRNSTIVLGEAKSTRLNTDSIAAVSDVW